MTTTNRPAAEDLQRWTTESNNFMETTGRKHFPSAKVDELFEQGARRCFKCQTVKPVSEFHANHRNRHGLSSECRGCGRSKGQQRHRANRDSELERMRQWYQDNKEQALERMAEWREENSDYYRLHRSANPWIDRLSKGYLRAERAGLPAERITQEQLLEHWESVGIDSTRSAYSGVLLTEANRGLDHTVPLSDPEGPGHVVTNLVPCTQEENSSKSKDHFIHLLAKVHDTNNTEEKEEVNQ